MCAVVYFECLGDILDSIYSLGLMNMSSVVCMLYVDEIYHVNSEIVTSVRFFFITTMMKMMMMFMKMIMMMMMMMMTMVMMMMMMPMKIMMMLMTMTMIMMI